MEKLQVRNKQLNAWYVVDCGKVYDARTMIELPKSWNITKGALAYCKAQMQMLWDEMGAIDPIWGDMEKYHKLEKQWLRFRQALYGNK